ncbi:predicted protein [Streptomyces viridosporus ATCC 14672]|uniref:Predicted protein n=1 Tax=Streptomyces viridosporus (strain ATCC 14672 / DSM 40746 / JCM 4963 / KCTC 9882 / NRRL B-12104 / FH 1290) TaxID=566461 RepID=D5ZXZ1_STRV1|nr:predicted protein [Streptomyces viridosporus ATCC 14672]
MRPVTRRVRSASHGRGTDRCGAVPGPAAVGTAGPRPLGAGGSNGGCRPARGGGIPH